MSGVQGLFGGGDAGEEQKSKAQDFINRYQKNPAGADVSEQEALEQLQQVAKVATPEQMQRAFQQSVASLPDDERAQFNQMLKQRQAGQGMIDIERSGERKAVDARSGGGDDTIGLDDLLGGILGGMAGGGGASNSGGGGLADILGGLLGGGASGNANATSGGGLGDVLSGMMGGGGAAAQPAPANDDSGGLGGLFGDLLGSPIGKAVLAGTAAYAMKEVLGK